MCIKGSDCHCREKRGSFFRPQASSSAALFVVLLQTLDYRDKRIQIETCSFVIFITIFGVFEFLI